MKRKIAISLISILTVGTVIYVNKQPEENQQIIISNKESTPPSIKNIQNNDSKTKNIEKTLIEKDFEKGLERIKEIEKERENKAKKEFEKTIQEIRDLGFEVDEENETVSVLKHIEGKDKISKSGHYTFHKLLNMKKFKEIRKYNENYKILLKSPFGEEFVINPEYNSEINYFSYRSRLTTDLLSDVPINIAFYFDDGYFDVFLEILENNRVDNLVYKYYMINDEIRLEIDYDAETGKKIKVNYISDVWKESEK